MNKMHTWISVLVLLSACTSDPIIPNTFVIDNPPIIPVQDPGNDNLCVEGVISFHHQILPIMVSACAYSGCHDANTAEEGIVLETYEDIIKEVTPGDPGESELYESITEDEGDEIMPPPPSSPLTRLQINTIRQWILQGAKNTDCGTSCNPDAASFKNDVLPILQDYCIGCHSSARSDGNVNIESYDQVLPYVGNGTLIGTIKHTEFYPVMPPSGSKISDCRITQIEKWIAEGAKNN